MPYSPLHTYVFICAIINNTALDDNLHLLLFIYICVVNSSNEALEIKPEGRNL